MVNELNVLAGDQAPAVLLDLLHADTAVELRHFVLCPVNAFTLPSVVNLRRPLDLLCDQADFLFVLVFDRVLRPGAKIHEKDFMLAIAQGPAMVVPALLVLVQNPEGDADIRCMKYW